MNGENGGEQALNGEKDTLLWLWLSQVVGPASGRGKELLEVYQTPGAVYDARLWEDFSPYLTPTQAERLRALSPESCLPILGRCQRAGIRILPYGAGEYPTRFLGMPDPPLVLYATGQPSVLAKGPTVGLVGSRRPSAYGVKAAQSLALTLAEAGVVLVSGLADGLDSEAHKAAVTAKSPTVGFLGCAIDNTYPSSNRPLRARMEENGAVFSEYAPGEKSVPACFLQRNRLIAAGCDLLCVVEARAQSGTMSTVRHAQRYGTPVFAVPGEIFAPQSEGTNALLAAGEAKPLSGPQTLLRALGIAGEERASSSRAKKLPSLSDEDARLLGQLRGGAKTLGQLCGALEKTPGEALASLTRLEMAGLVRSGAGGYSLC